MTKKPKRHKVPKKERKLLSRYIREEIRDNKKKPRGKKRKHGQVMAIAFSRWHESCKRRGACA